jgi:hypothetical protein
VSGRIENSRIMAAKNEKKNPKKNPNISEQKISDKLK